MRVSGDFLPSYEIRVSDRLAGHEVEELWRAARDASVFNHPSWWEAAYRGSGADRRLIAVSVYHEGRLEGYWPWWVKYLEARDGWARVLEPVGARLTDYVMPLVRAAHAQEVIWEIILDELKREMGLSTILFWPKTTSKKDIGAVIGRAFPANRYLTFKQEQPFPMLELAAGYEEIEAQWSRNHRKKIRRKTRRLAGQGNIELYVAATREEIVEATRRLVAMHRINWNARGQSSEFDTLASKTFIDYVSKHIPENLLNISELRLDGRAISSMLCFLDRNRLLTYKSAFSVDMAGYSPGFVHDVELIRWCCEQGISHYDFMEGTESYKSSWANTETITNSYAISSRAAYPFWLWNAKIRQLVIRYRP